VKRLKDAKFACIDVYDYDNIPINDDDDDSSKYYDVIVVVGLLSIEDLAVKGILIAIKNMLMPGGHLISTTTTTNDSGSSSIFNVHDWILEGMLRQQNLVLARGTLIENVFIKSSSSSLSSLSLDTLGEIITIQKRTVLCNVLGGMSILGEQLALMLKPSSTSSSSSSSSYHDLFKILKSNFGNRVTTDVADVVDCPVKLKQEYERHLKHERYYYYCYHYYYYYHCYCCYY